MTRYFYSNVKKDIKVMPEFIKNQEKYKIQVIDLTKFDKFS